VVPVVRLAAQRELELLQLLDCRGLELLEALRIGVDAVVVELPQIAQHVLELARAHAGLLQLTAKRIRVVRPLAPLVAELADVVAIPAPAVAVSAPVARVAAPVAALGRRPRRRRRSSSAARRGSRRCRPPCRARFRRLAE